MSQTIQVGERLNESEAMQLASDLQLSETERTVLDFSRTQHFEPFGMLLCIAAANRLRRRLENAGTQLVVEPTRIEAGGIAGHMGFWDALGLAVGRRVGSAGTSGYLPITRLDVGELVRSAVGGDVLAIGEIERRASQLALVLAVEGVPQLTEALGYALRELIRNVVEHAMSPSIWVCGMSWRHRGYLQVAILDEGRGIRASLADNERYRFADDITARREALRPGVSRNAGRTMSPARVERIQEQRTGLPPDIFANSGFGLPMVSRLCRDAGQFLIASGSAALGIIGGAEIQSATAHRGTALRLVLHPADVPGAWERLFSGEGFDLGTTPLLSASKLRRLGLDRLTGGEGKP